MQEKEDPAKDSEVWRKLDSDLAHILKNSLKGKVENKVNIFSDIIYDECLSRFGQTGKKEHMPKAKSRREKEILQLVKERRALRKVWKKAEEQEKQGLKALWNQVKSCLTSLRRAERIRKRWKKKESQCARFLKDPFRMARSLLEEKKSGTLVMAKEELEDHVRKQISDPGKHLPLGSPGYVPQPTAPSTEFEIVPPKLSEVNDVVRRASSSSAPGPNGIPYNLYKRCPQVLKELWKLMRVIWKQQSVPTEWRRAVAILIPKEQDLSTIDQF